uniref:Phospholipase-like protein n=1 Tax=Tanacetum cinerariifolium TaxID=118510 RepID=A0A6L2N2J7_TANCI|nr:hypothetical protein [Tanacetum cinerariifolium]
MDLSNYEVPHVLITCRSRMGLIKKIRKLISGTRREELFRNSCFGGETENVLLYYHMYDSFQIQFGREEFCLVTGLKFGVEYSDDYDKNDKPIPFRDANVKRWLPLYATESTNEDDKKLYSIFGFTWAFKTWILEVFRLGQNEYYTRHMRYPRIVAWTSNKKFYRPMLRDFLHDVYMRKD